MENIYVINTCASIHQKETVDQTCEECNRKYRQDLVGHIAVLSLVGVVVTFGEGLHEVCYSE